MRMYTDVWYTIVRMQRNARLSFFGYDKMLFILAYKFRKIVFCLHIYGWSTASNRFAYLPAAQRRIT